MADIDLPDIAGTGTIYGPTLTPGPVTISLPVIPAGRTLYGPTLVPGSVTISLPVKAGTRVPYGPTNLTPGPVTVSLPTQNNSAIYGPDSIVGSTGLVELPVIPRQATVRRGPRLIG